MYSFGGAHGWGMCIYDRLWTSWGSVHKKWKKPFANIFGVDCTRTEGTKIWKKVEKAYKVWTWRGSLVLRWAEGRGFI